MVRITSEQRPWGGFELFTKNEKTSVKLLRIKKNRRISYQYHRKRSEFWKVVQGSIRVTLNGKTKKLKSGDTLRIPLGAKHRMEGLSDSVILEIAYGNFDEKDVVRLQDDYNRV